jgi:hypothetical protein
MICVINKINHPTEMIVGVPDPDYPFPLGGF